MKMAEKGIAIWAHTMMIRVNGCSSQKGMQKMPALFFTLTLVYMVAKDPSILGLTLYK